MMRGMFSAISGLKNHQVMLDVTANDIANVNTIGYKSARTTFKDSLTQLQRGASGAGATNGGTNAAQVGLGVGLGLDRQPDVRRRTRSRPATPPTSRSRARASSGSRSRQARGHARPPSLSVHARRQLHHQHVGGTCSRRRASTSSASNAVGPARRPGHRRSHRRADPAAGRRHEPRHRPGRLGLPTSPPQAGPARPWASSRWPRSRTRPASSARPATAGSASANSGAEDVATPLVNVARAGRPPGNIEMSNVDLAQPFTEHDHRPARLPGQLARDHHLGRDAARPGQPQALVSARARRRREAGPRVTSTRPAPAGPSAFKTADPAADSPGRDDPSPQAGPRAATLPSEPGPRHHASRPARTPSSTLTTGSRLLVTETPEEVARAVRDWRASVLDAMTRVPAPLQLAVAGPRHRRRRRRAVAQRRGRAPGRRDPRRSTGHEVRHRHRHRHLLRRHRHGRDDGGHQRHGRPQRPGDPDRARRHARRDDRRLRPARPHQAAQALHEGDHARGPRPGRARQRDRRLRREGAPRRPARPRRGGQGDRRPVHAARASSSSSTARTPTSWPRCSTPRTRRCASATAAGRAPFMQAGALRPDDGHRRHGVRPRQRDEQPEQPVRARPADRGRVPRHADRRRLGERRLPPDGEPPQGALRGRSCTSAR